MPVPGDGRYEWRGVRRPTDLPQIKNPEKGWFASANEMNFPTGFTPSAPISFEWSDRSRIDRISQVMAAKPAMVPVTAPTRLGLPKLVHSIATQANVAVAAARCVTSMAMPASAPALSALPALNPNQPTHSRDAPTITIQGACGGRI